MKYTILGTVFPERAQCNIAKEVFKFGELGSGEDDHDCDFSVTCNKIVINISTDYRWDNLDDLRNIARDVSLRHVNVLGYMLGYGWDVDISQVINDELGINYVFGIGVDDVSEFRARTQDEINREFQRIKKLTGEEDGVFISQALYNFNEANKNPAETALYSYRAIESLRQIIRRNNPGESKSWTWDNLRDITSVSREELKVLEDASQAQRHGDIRPMSGQERVGHMKLAWRMIDAFMAQTCDAETV